MYTVPLRWPATRALPSGLPSLLRTPIAVMPATPSLRPDRSAASPSRAAAVGLAWLGLGLGLGLGLAYPHPDPDPNPNPTPNPDPDPDLELGVPQSAL